MRSTIDKEISDELKALKDDVDDFISDKNSVIYAITILILGCCLVAILNIYVESNITNIIISITTISLCFIALLYFLKSHEDLMGEAFTRSFISLSILVILLYLLDSTVEFIGFGIGLLISSILWCILFFRLIFRIFKSADQF